MVEFKELKTELQKRDDGKIPFSEQFFQCIKEGLTKETKFFSFEEYPQFLPALPGRPKVKKLVDAIRSGELKGHDFIVCGKFGGICNGGNDECRKMRGLEPTGRPQLR